MSTRINFTKGALDALPLPAPGTRVTYHDEGGRESVRGLHVRVTGNGTKTFGILMRPAGGAPERVTLGKYPALSIDRARALAKQKIAQLAEGVSPSAAKRESKVRSMTVAEAFADYTARKLRKEDDKPLKERTRRDYMDMLKQPRPTAAGRKTRGGYLAKLADRPIHELTGSEIFAVHAENLKRGERQASFAMMALKAVCRFHGVQIPDNPFDPKTTPAKQIRIKKPGVSPREPIKALRENLGTFWQALPDNAVGDYLKFLLLSGCRPGEPLKIKVGDLKGGAITLLDTKNRSNHALYPSRQALEVVQRQSIGKAPGDLLFNVKPAQANALAHELGEQLGFSFVVKNLRAVFASTAGKLCTIGVAKTMMNHKNRADLFGTNYDTPVEAELKEGWQRIADFVEQA